MSESSLRGFEAKPLARLNREIMMVNGEESGVECRDDHGKWCISSIVSALSFFNFRVKELLSLLHSKRQI
jgi:hypothetical protein